jgi:replicative DNA helicase
MTDTIQNVAAEKALIGALMVDPSDVSAVAEMIEPGDFFNPRWGSAFKAIYQHYHEGNTEMDAIVIADRMSGIGTDDPFSALLDAMAEANTMQTLNYAGVVKNTSQRRMILQTAEKMAAAAFAGEMTVEDILVDASARTDAILRREEDRMVDAHELMGDILNKSMDAAADGGIANISTGFGSLDQTFTRIRRGEFVVPAARPGHGKTALMVSMLDRMLDAGLRVMFFSGEMRAEDIGGRLLAYRLSRKFDMYASSRDITEGRMKQQEWDAVHRAMGELSLMKERFTVNRYFGSFKPGQIRNRIYAYELRHGRKPDVIMLDYLGLMDSDEKEPNTRERISSITRALKTMALDLDIVVIAASQLNRAIEIRAAKKPVLSDLRDSGSTEQDADRIWFIYRSEMTDDPDARPNIAEIIQEKMREGPTGQVDLYFSGVGGFKELGLKMIDINSDEAWSDELQQWKQSEVARTARDYD